MLSRRAFVAAGVAALGTVRHATAQGATGVRRSIRDLSGNDPDLVAFRRTVATMKALPPSDPRNWNRFADIHSNFCPHANWYFLPWHRAYLASFERLGRQFSGKPDFALPYWDWTADRQIPAALTAGSPRSNPLNSERDASPDQSLADDMVGREVVTRILNSPDFESFGSARPRGQDAPTVQWQRRIGAKTELEFNPHDGVHGWVGGDFAEVETAARDPLFYLHHANVDRLWSAWNRQGGANSPEPDWRNFAFIRNFINPNGSPWNVSVNDLQSTPALGYQYDDDDGPFAADVNIAAVAAGIDAPMVSQLRAYRRLGDSGLPRSTRELRRIALPTGGAVHYASVENDRAASPEQPLGIAVPLGRLLSDVLRPQALASARQAALEHRTDRQCVWATIRDIEPPSDVGTRVAVFVNREGFSSGRHAADPHYVTSLSFFGGKHMNHGNASAHDHARHGARAQAVTMTATGACVSFDLAPALSRLSRTKAFKDDKIVLQLVPVCPSGQSAGGRIRPRRVEIAII